MSLEKAKKQLTSIMTTTGNKHPKVLIRELCSVMRILLDAIERVETPLMEVLARPFEDEGVNLDPHPSQRSIPDIKKQPPMLDPEDPLQREYFPHRYPNRTKPIRDGNAGDTK